MAKLAPHDLAQVLSRLPRQPYDPNLLVGYETADDAGVYRISENLALVQTVDFFTPIADDPLIYGKIAAINALNDVYAMGGKPLTALTLACYPQKGDLEILGEILAGGQAAMIEAGVRVLGGHTIDDAEIKFGYAVTGLIEPDKVITNAGAQSGDALILTKPLGTGAIVTGLKKGLARPLAIDAAMEAMITSCALASEAMQAIGAHACTDVTGFGLLGHAYEMAKGSQVCLEIESAKVPLLPDVLDLIAKGMLTRGDKNNRVYVGETIEFAPQVAKEMQSALFDPQTAGGLLISLEAAKAEEYISRVPAARIIGKVTKFESKNLRVT